MMSGGKDYAPISIDYLQTNQINFDIFTRTKPIDIIDSTGRKTLYSNVNYNKNYVLDSTSSGVVLNFPNTTDNPNIKLYCRGGKDDIVSMLLLTGLTQNSNNILINNWYIFLAQFTGLESLLLFFARQTTTSSPLPVIKGNMIKVPNSLKYIAYTRIYVENQNVDFYCDFNDINSDNTLKYFKVDLQISQTPKIVGDLNNLPSTLEYFKIVNFGTGSNSTYTGVGKKFNAQFDTFYYNRTLPTAQLDQLLIDLNDSITSAVGDKIIYLRGTRTTASDSAVLGLQSKAFTVTITA